jgi:CBS domain-containing protein
MAKCSDVMTRDPQCCEPGEPVTRVAEVMKRQNVGSLPVVESRDSRRLVGIVTDRDLVTKVIAGGRDVRSATAQDAMTSDPARCAEGDDVDQAIALMAERQIRRMPVVDASGRLTGIIAQADVATRVNQDRQTGQMVESISSVGTTRR